jgi:hypothetical protein
MKTAVEWLYEHILLTPLDIRSINKCLEQAKEMEKEQHGKTWDEAIDEYSKYNTFEKYHNETFKSE